MPIDAEIERRLSALTHHVYALNLTVKALVDLLPEQQRATLEPAVLEQLQADVQLGGIAPRQGQ